MAKMLQTGPQFTPQELSRVIDEFKLYNIENKTYLEPVGAVTVEETSSDFDLLYYDEKDAGPLGYALECEGEIYLFDNMGKYSFSKEPLRERTVDVSELDELYSEETVVLSDEELGKVAGGTSPLLLTVKVVSNVIDATVKVVTKVV